MGRAEHELLEGVPHRQVVFTIHKRLRSLAVTTASSWESWPDGAFRPLAWFDSQHVERLFRAEVLRTLLGKELITEAVVENLLSWRHSGFSAHGAVQVEDRQGAVRLSLYMIRCPIVLKRLGWHADTGEVFYRGRPTRRRGADGGEARWYVLEFLARVVDHIPEPSQQMVRYWGFYANAARGKRRKAEQAEDTAQRLRRKDDDEFSRRTRLTWAKLIRRVYEVDPLLCPFGGSEMEVLAFIVDLPAKAIRKGLKFPAQKPEPLAHAGVAQHHSSGPIPALHGKAISYTVRPGPIGKQ